MKTQFSRRPAGALLVAILAATMAPRLVGAANSPPSTSRPTSGPLNATDLERLVAQLSSDNGSERQRAEDRLVQLGALAEPRLRELIDKGIDAEAVARARVALRLINENRLTGASVVTLHHHDAHPQAVLADLAKQAGLDLATEPAELWLQKDWPKVNVDLEGAPFWSAMLEVCRQTGVTPDVGQAGRVTIGAATDGDWAASPFSVAGPMLVQANELTVTRSVKLGKPADVEQTCTLALTVYAEPKLRVLHDVGSATIDLALDERRRSMVHEESREMALAGAGRTWELEVTLAIPPQASRKIAQLRGTLNVVVPVKIESTEITDVLNAKNVSRVVGGRRIVLRRVRKVQGAYEVQTTVYRDGLGDEEWQQLTNPTEFVSLLDEKGRALPFLGVTGNDDATDKQATVTLQFEAPLRVPVPAVSSSLPGKPAKLVWEVPVESRELHLPFEFKDLALP